jgi:hypothetical protein
MAFEGGRRAVERFRNSKIERRIGRSKNNGGIRGWGDREATFRLKTYQPNSIFPITFPLNQPWSSMVF